MPLVAPYGLAAAGGVLYFLGYLGYGVWPLLLAFLAPLWAGLTLAPDARRAAILGFVFGLVAFAGGFVWIWRLVDAFLGGDWLTGSILCLAYAVWFALGFAVYAALFQSIRARGWPLAVAGVPTLVVVEWLQPQVFPLYAGAGLVDATLLIQVADLGGPLLLTTIVGLVNVVVYESARWSLGHRRRPTATWSVALAGATLVLGYGLVRATRITSTAPVAPALRVGIVQANLGRLEKEMQSLLSHKRHLELTRELLAGGDVDLVVWPETAYVRGLRRPLPISGKLVVDDVDVALLFGASTVWEADGRRFKANSALLVGADGMIRDAYDKNLLIPLSEYTPFARAFPQLAEMLPDVEEFGAASETPALRLGSWRIATPICYEAIRPEFVRRMIRTADPHLIVTLANDAWFGDSQEPWLHFGLARLRAVEHRRYLVRATNSGISAIVDPIGRVVVRSGVLTRETLRGTVHLLDGETVYARLGDWPGWVSLAIVGLALVRPRRLAAR